MDNRSAVLRFVGVCALCALLMGIKTVSFVKNSTAFETLTEQTETGLTEALAQREDEEDVDQSENQSVESQPQQNTVGQTESIPQTPSAEQSVQANTAVVKGKIISRYISPYTAPLSYNNVYVKNSTGLNINLKKYLESALSFKLNKNDDPQVLIMHTHTTESFMNSDLEFYTEEFKSRNTDNTKNMVKIGGIVAEKLNSAGIKTLHDTTQHDYPEYTGSYSRAAETITQYLKKYPSIKIVLDLHRDAISSGESDKVKVVTEINGKKAAQVMLVMGSQSGTVTNFPRWEENFKLAVKLQQTMEVKYPALARPLMLMSKNYNESLSTGSLLIEFGTDANSLEEACYSAELVGESLVTLLNNLS